MDANSFGLKGINIEYMAATASDDVYDLRESNRCCWAFNPFRSKYFNNASSLMVMGNALVLYKFPNPATPP